MTWHHHSDIPLAEQFAAAHAWWQLAGVDCLFEDTAQAMLREPEAEAPKPAKAARAPLIEEVPAPSRPTFESADLPQDLASFSQWWCNSATPLPFQSAARVAPMGTQGSRIMIIAPMPETGDGPDLFTGPGGIMIRNMLAALELDQDAAYFATALPSLITAPDWDGLAAAGLGAVLAHHISLAQPRRVLLLGSTLARILPQEPAVPVLSAFAPEQLLAHPRQRARLWKRLLEWMPDE